MTTAPTDTQSQCQNRNVKMCDIIWYNYESHCSYECLAHYYEVGNREHIPVALTGLISYLFALICRSVVVAGMRRKAVVGATTLLRMQRSVHSAICGEHWQVFRQRSTDYHHDKHVNGDRGQCPRIWGGRV